MVKLPQPVGHDFTTTVRIIHQQGNHYGAEFDEIEREDARQLHHYIEKRLKQMDGKDLLKMIEDDNE